MKLRAQGTVEYLVLFAAILLIALIVISAVPNDSSTKTTILSDSQVYWKSVAVPFQVHLASAIYGDYCGESGKGGYQFIVRNAEAKNIRLTGVSVNGVSRDFCQPSQAKANAIAVPPAGSIIVQTQTTDGTPPCTEGEEVHLRLGFSYAGSDSSASMQSGVKDYIFSCVVQSPKDAGEYDIGTLGITAPISIEALPMPDSSVGAAYHYSDISASGGTGGYTWSVSGLPKGLSIDTQTGYVSGINLDEGTFPVKFTVTDSSHQSATASLSFTVIKVTTDDCGELSTENTAIILTQDIYLNNSTCFIVTAPNVTLDCGGKTVYNGMGVDIPTEPTNNSTLEPFGFFTNYDGTTLRNCHFVGFGVGIYYKDVVGGSIESSSATESISQGILLENTEGVTVIDSYGEVIRYEGVVEDIEDTNQEVDNLLRLSAASSDSSKASFAPGGTAHFSLFSNLQSAVSRLNALSYLPPGYGIYVAGGSGNSISGAGTTDAGSGCFVQDSPGNTLNNIECTSKYGEFLSSLTSLTTSISRLESAMPSSDQALFAEKGSTASFAPLSNLHKNLELLQQQLSLGGTTTNYGLGSGIRAIYSEMLNGITIENSEGTSASNCVGTTDGNHGIYALDSNGVRLSNCEGETTGGDTLRSYYLSAFQANSKVIQTSDEMLTMSADAPSANSGTTALFSPSTANFALSSGLSVASSGLQTSSLLARAPIGGLYSGIYFSASTNADIRDSSGKSDAGSGIRLLNSQSSEISNSDGTSTSLGYARYEFASVISSLASATQIGSGTSVASVDYFLNSHGIELTASQDSEVSGSRGTTSGGSGIYLDESPRSTVANSEGYSDASLYANMGAWNLCDALSPQISNVFDEVLSQIATQGASPSSDGAGTAQFGSKDAKFMLINTNVQALNSGSSSSLQSSQCGQLYNEIYTLMRLRGKTAQPVSYANFAPKTAQFALTTVDGGSGIATLPIMDGNGIGVDDSENTIITGSTGTAASGSGIRVSTSAQSTITNSIGKVEYDVNHWVELWTGVLGSHINVEDMLVESSNILATAMGPDLTRTPSQGTALFSPAEKGRPSGEFALSSGMRINRAADQASLRGNYNLYSIMPLETAHGIEVADSESSSIIGSSGISNIGAGVRVDASQGTIIDTTQGTSKWAYVLQQSMYNYQYGQYFGFTQSGSQILSIASQASQSVLQLLLGKNPSYVPDQDKRTALFSLSQIGSGVQTQSFEDIVLPFSEWPFHGIYVSDSPDSSISSSTGRSELRHGIYLERNDRIVMSDCTGEVDNVAIPAVEGDLMAAGPQQGSPPSQGLLKANELDLYALKKAGQKANFGG